MPAGVKIMNDERPNHMKRKMAEHFAENESEYRDNDWANIVYEDDEVILIEDLKGYEFNEWRLDFGEGFYESMHNLANQLVDRRWPASYPIVFDKVEDNSE